jgi:glutamyl-tRNA synthetase
MHSFYKTRIAPTPSGFLHAGNAYNFLRTVALAQQSGARVLLRIDDIDRDRYRPAYVNDIFETLDFLGIRWQEGPQHIDDFDRTWSQRHRHHLYLQALERLKQQQLVFACTCSRPQSAACTCLQKSLPLDTPGASWRLLTDDSPVEVKTVDGKIITAPLPPEMACFAVRRKDALPAYQLCSVVDDLHFGIDLIVRGADLWPCTLAQHFLARQLGEASFSRICFHHHPLLTNEKGEKLSKSAGAYSVKQWRESGRPLATYVQYLNTLLPKIK